GVDGANGVYLYATGGGFPNSASTSNYWVDVVFTPGSSGPLVTGETPANNATGAATGTAVAATFNESVTGSTVAFTLQDPGANVVAGPVPYDDTPHPATFTPNAPLANSTTYTATVSGATDAAGHVMTATSWSFTTAGTTATGDTIWDNTVAPAVT